MRKILEIVIVFLTLPISLYAQSWSELGTGGTALNAYGDIYAICSDNHGNIYAAGWFPTDSLSTVYKWDGALWTSLGHGSTALNPDCFCEITAIFADTSGNVYASATSANGNYVSKWNGTSWSQLGSGPAALYSSGIGAITMDKYGNLYVGGYYEADSPNYSYIAKWDGTSWSEVGTGANRLKANANINTIFVDSSGNIFAAGAFTDAPLDSSGNLYVAKWNGTTWSELGDGVYPQVSHDVQIFSVLEDTAGNVYAAGYFLSDSSEFVSKWDGTSWSELGTGTHALNGNGPINSLCFDKAGNLYAAGYFTDTTASVHIPPSPAYTVHPCYVAKWDGTDWQKLGVGVNALNANTYIMALCSDANGNIYAAGGFSDTTITFTYIDTFFGFSDTSYFHPRYVAKYGEPATTSVTPLSIISKINVYPNPTIDELNVTGVTQNTSYRLLTMTGVSVENGLLHAGSNIVPMQQFAPGVYVLEMTDADGKRNLVQVIKE